MFTVGNKNKGIDELIKQAITLAESDRKIIQRRRVKYNKDVETSVARLQACIEQQAGGGLAYNPRWTAIKLIEDDKIVQQHVLNKLPDRGKTILDEAENPAPSFDGTLRRRPGNPDDR